MIDTVRLIIPSEKFDVIEPKRFDPPATDIFKYAVFGAHASRSWIQNPTRQDRREGEYKPKLTITRRLVTGGASVTLAVEFSVPKLIFGNNFDELEEKDFDLVVRMLHSRLREMGVNVTEADIQTATVSAIHFSKNVPFLDYTTVSSVLKYLEKIHLPRRLDLNKAQFSNGGSAVYCYAKSYAFVFYDKIQDLKQPKGRGVEDNDVYPQMGIFDEIRRINKQPLEVLRLEFRIQRKRKIRELSRVIGEPMVETFQDFFRTRLSQKMLQHYWSFIMEMLKPVVLAESFNPQELLRLFLQKGKSLRPSTAMQLIGLLYCVRELGVRPFKSMLHIYFPGRACQRYMGQINGLEFPQSRKFEPFDHISKVLAEFKPLKMQDLALPF